MFAGFNVEIWALDLLFVDEGIPQLDRLVFTGLGESERVSVRGREVPSYRAANSFLWTAAVQAMTILLLRVAAWKKESTEAGRDSVPVLVGDGGTPASSLDYALSKMPNWLADMFGFDEAGIPNSRVLFRRQNPERKHAGPVVVSLCDQAIRNLAIRVFVNKDELSASAEQRRLSERIELNWTQPKAVVRNSDAENPQSQPRDLVPWVSSISGANASQFLLQRDLLRRYTKIWTNVSDDTSPDAISATKKLFEASDVKTVICLDRSAEIEIVNPEGDARVEFSLGLLNLTDHWIRGHSYASKFDHPTTLVTEDIRGRLADGSPCQLDIRENTSDRLSFGYLFPRPLEPAQSLRVTISFFRRGLFACGVSEDCHSWDIVVPMLTNKIRFAVSHHKRKPLNGVQVLRETLDGFIIQEAPDVEIESDLEKACILWSWEKPTIGGSFRTFWDFL